MKNEQSKVVYLKIDQRHNAISEEPYEFRDLDHALSWLRQDYIQVSLPKTEIQMAIKKTGICECCGQPAESFFPVDKWTALDFLYENRHIPTENQKKSTA